MNLVIALYAYQITQKHIVLNIMEIERMRLLSSLYIKIIDSTKLININDLSNLWKIQNYTNTQTNTIYEIY
jgi:hypothetical protein